MIDVEKEFDARGESGKRCDRMLFYDNDAKKTFIAVPIELKSGKAEESDVREKLENSLKCRYHRSDSKGEWRNRLRSSAVPRTGH